MRLPHILTSGKLRPSDNNIGGFPSPDFLWATASASGDATSSSYEPYRRGQVILVRIALSEESFIRWSAAPSLFPQWTNDHVERLEGVARECGVDPSNWFCRATPLPEGEWIGIETRTYTSPWRPLKTKEVVPLQDGYLGIKISGKKIISRKKLGPQGQVGYELGKIFEA